jgi:hypothetical protein
MRASACGRPALPLSHKKKPRPGQSLQAQTGVDSVTAVRNCTRDGGRPFGAAL